jgi:hypothetical protein
MKHQTCGNPAVAKGPAGQAELEQFQERCERFFRPELRKNKEIERFAVSMKR